MIDFDSNAVAAYACESFAGSVASIAHQTTGMEFVVMPVDGGSAREVVTSHPEAVAREYGTVDTPGGSWSVKAIIEAERRLNE